jgi:hypothetical protein
MAAMEESDSHLGVHCAHSVFSVADARFRCADNVVIMRPATGMAEEWTAAAAHLCVGISANPAVTTMSYTCPVFNHHRPFLNTVAGGVSGRAAASVDGNTFDQCS